ncbi:MAG: response regulator [Desulfovibrionaceae bacterium]|nr:response regulator [Desulfovibrionaceae bacterium]
MNSILYADSEPLAVRALGAALHRHRDRFRIVAADSGAAALGLMEQEPFDIIMADIRLADMRGEQLLQAARERQPQAVRIILTGSPDQEQAMRTVKVAHQFLTKPCPPETISAAILRCLRLRKVFLNEHTARVIAAVDVLPALPDIYLRLTHELAKEYPSINAVAGLVGSDVSMTASLLKLVNSTFFGLYERISSPKRAIALLGMDIVKGVVLGMKLFQSFNMIRFKDFSLSQLQEHSTRCCFFARSIAEMEGLGPGDRDTAFLAGLLHDIGKLLLASSFTDKYLEVLQTSQRENIPLTNAELDVLGYTHAEIGAYLLGLWGFSDDLVEAVYAHHDMSRSSEGLTPGVIVHAANSLDHELFIFHGDYALHPPDMFWLDRNDLLARYKAWRLACMEVADRDPANLRRGMALAATIEERA